MQILLASAGLALALQVHAATAPVRGVDPALAARYQPSTDSVGEPTWTCLDGSKTIPWSAVNDDYCDCSDGSDEPGTSACADSTFYCVNEGHIPAIIHSSRVNDGICDPECCDGSDEWDSWVKCPNRCAEIGKKHRDALAAETKIRKTGSKIRSSYISFAKGERTRLAEALRKLEKEMVAKEAEVEAARVRLERYESADKEILEKRKQSPLYLSLLAHREALDRLKEQAKKTQEDLDTLKGILKELSENYNPNYQDMAVKAAVVGYTENFVRGEGSPDEEEDGRGELKTTLEELQRTDLTGLLMAGDGDTAESSDDGGDDSTLYRIDQYIPDSLYEPYELVRDALLTWLVRFGLLGSDARKAVSSAEAPHTAAARATFNTLTEDLSNLRNELRKTKESTEKLDTNFGPQAEWKKLDGTCIEKEQSGYMYSLCFFQRATQKSLRDSSTVHLGNFHSWNPAPDTDENTEAYYSKQLYNAGAKCWNGPERSVKVDITCGTTNELLSVSEPEKCEYLFKVTSPGLCWPDLAWEKQQTEENAQAKPVSLKEEL